LRRRADELRRWASELRGRVGELRGWVGGLRKRARVLRRWAAVWRNAFLDPERSLSDVHLDSREREPAGHLVDDVDLAGVKTGLEAGGGDLELENGRVTIRRID
jgi:hypothetical protein